MNSQTPSEATMMNASRSPSGSMPEMRLGARVRARCMICAGTRGASWGRAGREGSVGGGGHGERGGRNAWQCG